MANMLFLSIILMLTLNVYGKQNSLSNQQRILKISVQENKKMNQVLFSKKTFKNRHYLSSDFTGAIFFRAIFKNFSFRKSLFLGVQIKNSTFIGGDFIGVDFSNASITDSLLVDCILPNDFSKKALLINVKIENCRYE